MKHLSIIFIWVFGSVTLLAQNSIIWKGGTPGKETSWNEPKNWDLNQIPDFNSHVVIKSINSGHQSQPRIDSRVAVASIEIHSGSTLIIGERGDVLIDGEYTFSQGIVNYGGKFINNGKIELRNIEPYDIQKSEEIIVKEELRNNLNNKSSYLFFMVMF